MVNDNANELSHADLVQSPVVNPERGNYNYVTPLTPERSLRPTILLTPTSGNSSTPTRDNEIVASPNDSEIRNESCEQR